MKKQYKVLLSIVPMFCGWLLAGFGFTTKMGHPISTICFSLGMCVSFLGAICFFYNLIKND